MNPEPETLGETILGMFVLVFVLACIVLTFAMLAPESVPACSTDTECAELYGGDGGPMPVEPDCANTVDPYACSEASR